MSGYIGSSGVCGEDVTILRTFLNADGGFVSGVALAETIGVSRVSISSRIHNLELAGFKFSAIRNKGYRLEQEPTELHDSLLEAYLINNHVNVSVFSYKEIDSTNSEAERLIADGRDTPFVVFSTRQTAGRGRKGRCWQSQSAQNLYFSFAFRPQLPPSRMTKFTLWMGVALCDLLDETWGIPARIKWPNDLLCNGRKLAGMLTEARIDTDTMRDIIFGLGLNVNSQLTDFPEELRGIATSMRDISGKTFSINALAASVIQCLLKAYDDFIGGAFEAVLKKRWIDYDCLNGKRVKAETATGKLYGIVAGLNEDGSLAIVGEDGVKIALWAGDVSLTTQGVQ